MRSTTTKTAVTLTEFFVKAPEKGSSYDINFMFVLVTR